LIVVPEEITDECARGKSEVKFGKLNNPNCGHATAQKTKTEIEVR
jgi:hypothetical protein